VLYVYKESGAPLVKRKRVSEKEMEKGILNGFSNFLLHKGTKLVLETSRAPLIKIILTI